MKIEDKLKLIELFNEYYREEIKLILRAWELNYKLESGKSNHLFARTFKCGEEAEELFEVMKQSLVHDILSTFVFQPEGLGDYCEEEED